MKKIKKFQQEYEDKETYETTDAEAELYGLTIDLQVLKDEIKELIGLYQIGCAESGDALLLIEMVKGMKQDADEFLHYLMEENDRKRNGNGLV